jgi:hypothetical protein
MPAHPCHRRDTEGLDRHSSSSCLSISEFRTSFGLLAMLLYVSLWWRIYGYQTDDRIVEGRICYVGTDARSLGNRLWGRLARLYRMCGRRRSVWKDAWRLYSYVRKLFLHLQTWNSLCERLVSRRSFRIGRKIRGTQGESCAISARLYPEQSQLLFAMDRTLRKHLSSCLLSVLGAY